MEITGALSTRGCACSSHDDPSFARRYHEWCEQVFDKIQDSILSQVDTLSEKEIEHKKAALYQEFLDATRRKVSARQFRPRRDSWHRAEALPA